MSVTGRHQGNPYRCTWPALAAAIGLLASPCAHGETPAPPAPPMTTETPDAKPKADLADSWAIMIGFGLDLFCSANACTVNKTHDVDRFVFSISDLKITIPIASIFGEESFIQAKEVELQSSRRGIVNMNGFPDSLKISLRDVQANEDMAKNLAKMVAPSDALTQQLLAQELSKTKLALSITMRNVSDWLEVTVVIEANASDSMTLAFAFYIPAEIRKFLISKVYTNDGARKASPATGVMLFEAMNWDKILSIPVPRATLTFEEQTLLDKFYTKFLFSKKSDGERAYWQKMLNAVLAEPVDTNRKSVAEIIRFLSNWREKAHRVTVAVEDPRAIELLEKPLVETMVGPDSSYCSVGMVPLISIATYYAFLPYLMPDEDAAIRAARDATAFGDNLNDGKLGLGTAELMKLARCNKVQFSATYKAP